MSFSGLFLGSAEEAISTFIEARLFDDDLFLFFDGRRLALTQEFNSYADAQLFTLCFNAGSQGGYFWTVWVNSNRSYDETDNRYKVDICEDLGIHPKNCYQADWGNIPKCDPTKDGFDPDDLKNEILPALKDVAIEPQSWFNRPGTGSNPRSSTLGGLLHGRVDPDVNHLAHGKYSVKRR